MELFAFQGLKTSARPMQDWALSKWSKKKTTNKQTTINKTKTKTLISCIFTSWRNGLNEHLCWTCLCDSHIRDLKIKVLALVIWEAISISALSPSKRIQIRHWLENASFISCTLNPLFGKCITWNHKGIFVLRQLALSVHPQALLPGARCDLCLPGELQLHGQEAPCSPWLNTQRMKLPRSEGSILK